jgi:transposase
MRITHSLATAASLTPPSSRRCLKDSPSFACTPYCTRARPLSDESLMPHPTVDILRNVCRISFSPTRFPQSSVSPTLPTHKRVQASQPLAFPEACLPMALRKVGPVERGSAKLFIASRLNPQKPKRPRGAISLRQISVACRQCAQGRNTGKGFETSRHDG